MDHVTKAIHKQGVFLILIYVPVACALLQLFAWSRYTLKGQRLLHVKAIREGVLHIPV